VGRKPDLCVSGINHGYNLGSDIFYSGTVAAAVEAALRGVPSIAVSLERRRHPDFTAAGAFVRALVAEVLRRGPGAIPPQALLNVNLPSEAISGHEVTFLGKRVYRDLVDVRQDLRGRSYFWIGGPEEHVEDAPGSDCSAVRAGRASVTPLSLDLTHRRMLDDLRGWSLEGFAPPMGT
jgi:5'-nucleotidase